MRFELDTIATPEQVRAALTDFTDRRSEIWSRTLDPRRYEVREQGDTWAVAKESSPRSPFWVVSRYDWSDPREVRWTVIESSYGGGGEGVVTITPRDSRGSHLDVRWDNVDPRPLQRPLLFVLHRGPMGRLIAHVAAGAGPVRRVPICRLVRAAQLSGRTTGQPASRHAFTPPSRWATSK